MPANFGVTRLRLLRTTGHCRQSTTTRRPAARSEQLNSTGTAITPSAAIHDLLSGGGPNRF